ncbi:ATP-grasp domain-containing protein [Sphingomonas flavalba]|uniref:ATP-grasp domain-containing protein n=1 Tax=Sphingomonas flavalba TaxID=2559804 RepID=UPI0014475AC4|nr:ATP-grasp domain-containing protein [Sphingomonas flavalba]
MTTRPLLVSGIGKRNALLRLLKQECALYGMDVLGCDAAPFPPARVEVDHFEVVPLASDSAFVAAFAAILERYAPLAHMTLIDPEIPLLGGLERDGACGGSLLLHPVEDTARLCEDKYAFYDFLTENALPGVPTFLAPPAQFPFIRKDRRGSAASGFHVFHAPADLAPHFEQNHDPRYIFQPFCAGTHYCIDAYYALADGTLVDCCVKEVLSKKDGESYLLRAAVRDPFVDLLRQIGSTLPLRGIVNLDIYLDDGVLKIMEINCRIGGNYPASYAFGCNLLAHMLADIHGEAPAPAYSPSSYIVGGYISKYFAFTDVYTGSRQ